VARTRVTYKFPAAFGGGKLVIRELNTEEMINVSQFITQNVARFVAERSKRAVVECRGTKWDAENRDGMWDLLTAKEHDLVNSAVGRLHNATGEEEVDFFATAEVTVET